MDIQKYISVQTLNKYIKAKFDQDASLRNVYITGEISNFRPHPSGHLYFTLKDDHARVSAIMFYSNARKLSFQVENGMKVYIRAYVSVYEPSGDYQLYVQSMEQDGLGKLYVEFENLKNDILNVISTLKDREQAVVKMRYGIDNDTKMTLEEIGNIYGVTKECIRQTELRALKKMRFSVLGQEVLATYID